MKKHFSNFIPKSFTCFQEGYSRKTLLDDLFAGISVGFIALPLALAFGIGSGVTPEKGLFTAIVAGFLISFLGGSRVQIGGPTGAFVPIVYGVIQQFGYEGLAIATLMAGIMMMLMGIARFGVLLKFIPYPVTTGFTTGIAVVIFTSQLKDFFGLQISQNSPHFLEKCKYLCINAHTWNPWAVVISLGTLLGIFVLRHWFPRFPGAIFTITITTAAAFLWNLPVETIESKFGSIPSFLPEATFPEITYEKIKILFPSAIVIALLGAIESLLSAVVADGVIGHKHRSNMELIAQGFANVGSIIFGGIPATGAIARTSANIRLGAKTPLAGMVHAVTLLVLMIALSTLAGKIPLAALSAVLVYVAWNMSEPEKFYEILRGQKTEALILLITFLLTVLIDLAVAVQVGVVLAAFLFLKKLSDSSTVQATKILIEENLHEYLEASDEDILFQHNIPKDVAIFEIKGPFFYSVTDQLSEALINLEKTPRVFILRMRHVPLIDSTGIYALRSFAKKCKQKKITFVISGIHSGSYLEKTLRDAGLDQEIGKENIFPNIKTALKSV